MKIKEFIEAINPKMPKKFSNYFITTEKMFDIFRLDSSKNVSCYSTILESNLPNFNPSFIYYAEPSNKVYLYAHFTNRKGEVIKIRLGSFGFISDKLLNLGFTNSNYKHLIRVIRRILGEKPKKGRADLSTLIVGSFIIEERKKYSHPKKIDYYTYTFTDNTVKTLSKENAYIASDLVIQNGIGIKEVSLKSKYNFEHVFDVTYLI